MICTKCKQDGIENTALGKTFWYCRVCKEEIQYESISDATKVYRDFWGKVMKPQGVTSPIVLELLEKEFIKSQIDALSLKISETNKLMVPTIKIDEDYRDPKSSRKIQVIGDSDAPCDYFVDASRYISGPPSKSHVFDTDSECCIYCDYSLTEYKTFGGSCPR